MREYHPFPVLDETVDSETFSQPFQTGPTSRLSIQIWFDDDVDASGLELQSTNYGEFEHDDDSVWATEEQVPVPDLEDGPASVMVHIDSANVRFMRLRVPAPASAGKIQVLVLYKAS